MTLTVIALAEVHKLLSRQQSGTREAQSASQSFKKERKPMNRQEMQDYFENTTGHGVLATADAQGKVNQAVFSRPHVMEDGTLAFIMPHRLTHKNLEENPHAAYLFMEGGPGYKGKRVYLTKVREEQDTDLLYSLRRRTYPAAKDKEEGPRFLVFFRVNLVLPLIGSGAKTS
jgi:hypothetical protein